MPLKLVSARRCVQVFVLQNSKPRYELTAISPVGEKAKSAIFARAVIVVSGSNPGRLYTWSQGVKGRKIAKYWPSGEIPLMP